MKVIIAGSRTIKDYNELLSALEDAKTKIPNFEITEVVSGTAEGVDLLGERYAHEKGIPVTRFKAHWEAFGKSAGYMRNMEMARYAHALVLVWDGHSTGSAMMKRIARTVMLPYHERVVRQDWF